MKKLEDSWKICALCRHLEILEEGEEFPGILDTRYLVFRCRNLGWRSREDYLMEPVSQDLELPAARVCPFWEPWEASS
ncbi:MAG: hypothetical protein ACOX9B_09150 [Candidatus Xenobium sp.]|jgi:hypothetical protein|nr:hypothetical protein [Burkholderiales bacterium]